MAAITVAPDTEELILDLVQRTRNDARLAYGASPRASMALYQGAQALAAIRASRRAAQTRCASWRPPSC